MYHSLKLYFQVIQENFGCITPFGYDFNGTICANLTISQLARGKVDELKEKARFGNIPECPYPCKFSNIILTNRNSMPAKLSLGYLKLNFAEMIKLTTYSYSYGVLELLAEIGGYVGLFLGLSVYHLREVIKILFQLWR